MKIKSYILGIGVVAVLLSSQSFAATTPSTKKTIILNNRTYTLNVCDANDVDSLRIKVIVGLKGKSLVTKRKVYTQFKLLQAARAKTCPSTSTVQQQQVIPTNNFTTITNPEFIAGLSDSQKSKAKERSDLYTVAAEKIVDTMITQGLLNAIDKDIIKGKVELNYVNDCKKIDGITSVKQRYDGNKKRIKNDLISISLNVSVCESENFNSLFTTSYKHVFIHELGHYIYYLKDNDVTSFENICRDSNEKKLPACISYDTFYSKYAMGSPAEDYAETFAYWYQNKKPEFDLQSNNINLTTLNLKAQHFSDLFKK